VERLRQDLTSNRKKRKTSHASPYKETVADSSPQNDAAAKQVPTVADSSPQNDAAPTQVPAVAGLVGGAVNLTSTAQQLLGKTNKKAQAAPPAADPPTIEQQPWLRMVPAINQKHELPSFSLPRWAGDFNKIESESFIHGSLRLTGFYLTLSKPLS